MYTSPTPIRKIVHSVASAIDGLLRGRQQPFQIHLRDGEIEFQANTFWLTRAIAALLQNASDAGGDGVTLTLASERVGDQLQLRIRNAPAEFEELSRGDDFEYCASDGRSVRDLTVARRIIGLHGGRVTAGRLVGGLVTVFVIELPLERAAEPVAA